MTNYCDPKTLILLRLNTSQHPIGSNCPRGADCICGEERAKQKFIRRIEKKFGLKPQVL